MAFPGGDDGRLPGEIEIQRINNRVLGFPEETAPILTPEKGCQILAFGTLEALLTNIRRYNEAFAIIQSTPQIDDTDSVTPAFRSLIAAGKDIQTVGTYLRCVQLLDEEWHASPGVQLLLNPDTATDLTSIALGERERRQNEREREREEAARKKAIYEITERRRKERLEKAIRESIKIMMSLHALGLEDESTTSTTAEGSTEADKDESTALEIQNSSQPTPVEDWGSGDAPLAVEKEIKPRKAARPPAVMPKIGNPSSPVSQSIASSQDVVVEVPSPESLNKRKRANTASTKAKPGPKRARIVDKLSLRGAT